MMPFSSSHYLLLVIAITSATAAISLRTQQGTIYGRQTQHSIEYLGIQYAKVIRWKPPIDLAETPFPNGSLHATSFGPCCPQPKTNAYIPMQDEQCLYLNIYQPLVPSNQSLLPVFVWIHGGAHNHGCSSQSIPLLFNGTNLIAHAPEQQPVIIITINYRLSVLADMFLDELIEEDAQWPTAGNYMYLDMLSALRWIQKNIRDYGGDASSVSLFGQSAGGLSVVDLGAVKGSAHLYRTAISQSGLGSPGSASSYYNMSNARDYSKSIVRQLHCENEDRRKVLSCLRNASFHDLLSVYGNRYTRPIIDNYFFPFYPLAAIQNGTYNNISLIMGHNDYEQPICFHHPLMNLKEAIALLNQTIDHRWIPAIVSYYHLDNCSSKPNANNTRCCHIVRLILTDEIFDCDIRRLFNAFDENHRAQNAGMKLFSYHLDCSPRCPFVAYEGICRHSSELPYVFGTVSDADSHKAVHCTWDNQSQRFSNEVIAHWVNIAAAGAPLRQWPSYNPVTPKYFYLTPDQAFSSETWDRNCTFFDQMEAGIALRTFGDKLNNSKDAPN